jgi:hypothetical protein
MLVVRRLRCAVTSVRFLHKLPQYVTAPIGCPWVPGLPHNSTKITTQKRESYYQVGLDNPHSTGCQRPAWLACNILLPSERPKQVRSGYREPRILCPRSRIQRSPRPHLSRLEGRSTVSGHSSERQLPFVREGNMQGNHHPNNRPHSGHSCSVFWQHCAGGCAQSSLRCFGYDAYIPEQSSGRNPRQLWEAVDQIHPACMERRRTLVD